MRLLMCLSPMGLLLLLLLLYKMPQQLDLSR